MHDAAIEAGLVARPDRVVTDDEFNAAYRDELAAQVKRMKLDRTVEELEELEEEGGEDEAQIMAQIRSRRIEELKQARAKKLSEGKELFEVDPFDFEQQVQVPSRQGWVLLLVYRGSHADSALMQGLLRAFATAHPSILCLQMHVSQHIANLPPQDCPVLLVYREGKVRKQFVRLESLAGKETNQQGTLAHTTNPCVQAYSICAKTPYRGSPRASWQVFRFTLLASSATAAHSLVVPGCVCACVRCILCAVYPVLEWELSDLGVLETSLEEDPKLRIENARKVALRAQQLADQSDDSDDD